MFFGGFFCVGGLAVYVALKSAPALIGGILMICLGVGICDYGRFICYKGRCFLTLPAEKLLKKDKRPPILFLRPFDIDETLSDFFKGEKRVESQENLIVNFFDGFGPVVTIGQPGEKVPSRGAARFYFHGEDWKTEIIKLIDQSRFVLVALGDSPGISYELKMVVEKIPPERILLFLPLSGNRNEQFKTIQKILPIRILPDISPVINHILIFVYFDENWNPYVFSDKGGVKFIFSSKENCLVGLYPFLKQFGAQKSRRRPSWIFWVVLLETLIIVIAFLIPTEDNKKIDDFLSKNKQKPALSMPEPIIQLDRQKWLGTPFEEEINNLLLLIERNPNDYYLKNRLKFLLKEVETLCILRKQGDEYLKNMRENADETLILKMPKIYFRSVPDIGANKSETKAAK